MSCYDVLPCELCAAIAAIWLMLSGRLRLHGSRTMARRNKDVHLGSHLLHQDEAVSHPELSVRLGQLTSSFPEFD